MAANKTFSAQVDAWTKKSTNRMLAVFQTAVQETIADSQTVGPSIAHPGGGDGGRMPVDEGFLRASGQASLNGWPVGPSRPNEAADDPRYKDQDVDLIINNSKLGDAIHFGWTAGYARYIEERYGFMRGAVMKWRENVRDAIRQAKSRYP